jgi:hypothetical protein
LAAFFTDPRRPYARGPGAAMTLVTVRVEGHGHAITA